MINIIGVKKTPAKANTDVGIFDFSRELIIEIGITGIKNIKIAENILDL